MISFKRKRTKLINFFFKSCSLTSLLTISIIRMRFRREKQSHTESTLAPMQWSFCTMIRSKKQSTHFPIYLLCSMHPVIFGNSLDFCFQQRDLSSNLFGFVVLGCGHCTLFKPVFAEAAKIIKKTQIGTLAAIDGSVYHEISKRYDLTGYPTMKHFKNGRLTGDYDGRRNVDSIFKFMANHDKKKKDEL